MKKLVSLILMIILLVLVLTSCNLLNTAYNSLGITRYTVTAKEWQNAFNYTNYTMIYINDDHKSVTLRDYPNQCYEVYDFDKQSYSIYYRNLQTGAVLEKSNDKWVERIDKDLIEKENKISLNTFKSFVSYQDYEYNFKDFKFDIFTNSYILSYEAAPGAQATYYYKFENGKLISIEMIVQDIEFTSKQIIINIGTTVVNMPEITN